MCLCQQKDTKNFIINEATDDEVIGYFQAHRENSIPNMIKGFTEEILKDLLRPDYFNRFFRGIQRKLLLSVSIIWSYWSGHIGIWQDESIYSNSVMYNRKIHHYLVEWKTVVSTTRGLPIRLRFCLGCALIGSPIVDTFY